MLEFAILGLLQETPMHGYELRKRLTTMLGAFRAAISYGSLYPTLRRMREAGWIVEETPDPDGTGSPVTGDVAETRTARRKAIGGFVEAAEGRASRITRVGGFGKRGKVVYRLTVEGKERFADLLAKTGPETYDDPGFGVHFAFFSRTDAATRLRILEGRRRRVEERREGLRETLSRAAERLDAYTLELQRHGLDACDREVRWLEELIASEREGQPPTVTVVEPGPTGSTTTHPTHDTIRPDPGTEPGARR